MVSKNELIPQPPLQASSALPLHHHPNTKGFLTSKVDVAKRSAITALLMPLGACAISQNNIQNIMRGAQSRQRKIQLSPYFQGEFALVIPWYLRCILKAPYSTVSPAEAKNCHMSKKPQHL